MNHKKEIHIFCKNIKRLRETERLTQKEMAERLGIGVSSLIKLEKGILPPRLTCEILFCIQRRFGIPPEKMFTENGVEKLSKNAPSESRTKP